MSIEVRSGVTPPALTGSKQNVPTDTELGHPYRSLVDLLATIAAAQNYGEALEKVFSHLNGRYGVRAMALELVTDGITRFQPYGDIAVFTDVVQELSLESQWRELVCEFDHSTGPKGRVTYVYPAESPLSTDLLKVISNQIGMRTGLDALRQRVETAEDRLQHRVSEVATIYEIGQAIDQIEHSRLLQLITDRAALLMDAQACSLMLLDPEKGSLHVAASHGLPDEAIAQEQRIGVGIAGRVAQTEQAILIVGNVADPRLSGVTLKPDIGSSMLVPMKNQDGEVLGVLSIRRRRPAADFVDSDLKLFSVFATQASLALTNKRLYDDLTQRAAELLKISNLSRALTSINLDELLERVADDICGTVGFARCCLFMRDANRQAFVASVWRGYPDSVVRNPIGDREGIVGATAQSKLPRLYDARVAPTRMERDRTDRLMNGFARSIGSDSFVSLPILTSKNDCVGVVIADNKGKRRPNISEQVRLLTAFVGQAGIAIENARLHDRTQRMTDYTRNVLRSIGDGIVSTDEQGHIAHWNPAAAALLNLPPAFFRNVGLNDVIAAMHLSEADLDHLRRLVQRVQETGEPTQLHGLTLHAEGQDPSILNVKLFRIGDPILDRGGIVVTLEDVTQEIQMQAEMERMRRLADIGQLAAKMAHEVRNALSPIKGAAQIIRLESEGQGGSVEWPDIIIAEVDGLSHLTSAMLDFARPAPLDLRVLDMLQFLTSSVLSLQAFLTEKRVAVEWDLPPELPIALCDPVQLGQVVRNLVINAAQSMTSAEGGAIYISARFDPQTRLIGLRFKDTGSGIDREDLDRIFRPFVTTKPKGTGLGLSIVQKIVDNHGGRVEVESQVGVGTRFSVFLPLRPPRDVGDDSIDEPPLISADSGGRFPDN